MYLEIYKLNRYANAVEICGTAFINQFSLSTFFLCCFFTAIQIQSGFTFFQLRLVYWLLKCLLFENRSQSLASRWFLSIGNIELRLLLNENLCARVLIKTNMGDSLLVLSVCLKRVSNDQLRFASKWHGLTSGVYLLLSLSLSFSLSLFGSFGDNCNNCHGRYCSGRCRAEYFEEAAGVRRPCI